MARRIASKTGSEFTDLRRYRIRIHIQSGDMRGGQHLPRRLARTAFRIRRIDHDLDIIREIDRIPYCSHRQRQCHHENNATEHRHLHAFFRSRRVHHSPLGFRIAFGVRPTATSGERGHRLVCNHDAHRARIGADRRVHDISRTQ